MYISFILFCTGRTCNHRIRKICYNKRVTGRLGRQCCSAVEVRSRDTDEERVACRAIYRAKSDNYPYSRTKIPHLDPFPYIRRFSTAYYHPRNYNSASYYHTSLSCHVVFNRKYRFINYKLKDASIYYIYMR